MNKKLLLTLIATLLVIQPAQASVWSSVSNRKNLLGVVAAVAIGKFAYYLYKTIIKHASFNSKVRIEQVSGGKFSSGEDATEILSKLHDSLAKLEEKVQDFLQRNGVRSVESQLSYSRQYDQLNLHEHTDMLACLVKIDSLKEDVANIEDGSWPVKQRAQMLLDDAGTLEVEFDQKSRSILFA